MHAGAALVLLLVMAACQPPPPHTATATGSPPEATPPEGSAQPGGEALAGLPVVPGATRPAPATDAGGIIATWTSADDGPAVYDFYVAALPAAGFSIIELLPGGAVAVIRFASPDGHAHELLFSPSAGGTRVQLREGGQEP